MKLKIRKADFQEGLIYKEGIKGENMAFDAKVYKVFIACPNDVKKEKETVKKAIAKWNSMHAEEKGVVLLPISWDINAGVESGQYPQDYINENLLDKCDILIGVFWATVGQPTKKANGGTVEEIERHIARRKLAMLYFSTKSVPQDKKKLDSVKKVLKLKEKYKDSSLYGEFSSPSDLEEKVYEHLVICMNIGKVRPKFDSDILACIEDDKKLAKEIKEHFPTVSLNLLKKIVDEKRTDLVWSAIIDKLGESPVEMRDALEFLAMRGAFRHKAYMDGYQKLADTDQRCFGQFMNSLYSVNAYEFEYILEKGIWADCEYKSRILAKIAEGE